MIRPLGWMGRVKSGGIGGMALLDGEEDVRAADDVMDVVVQLTGGACGAKSWWSDGEDMQTLTLSLRKSTSHGIEHEG